jgi:hypothetical protein
MRRRRRLPFNHVTEQRLKLLLRVGHADLPHNQTPTQSRKPLTPEMLCSTFPFNRAA